MSARVLDCSAALCRILPDEGDAATDALLDTDAEAGATVPAPWPCEVGHVLLVAERRTRITPAERRQALTVLGDLPVRIDPQSPARAWTDTLVLAQAHRLTAYDASYRELASRHGLPLATRDAAFRNAAAVCGVTPSI